MSTVSQFPLTEQGQTQSPKTALLSSEGKVQKETVFEYLRVFGFHKTLSEAEIQQFIQTALAGNLDPFKREIYVAVYGEKENRRVSILTGYQVYLKRAERTGKLNGWHAWIDGSGESMKAIVEIFRKDWSNSFTHEAYWQEAVQKKKDGTPTQFWTKQPRFQLKKVAIAQAFRLAFPDELGGLPYESAELPDSENTGTETPATVIPHGNEKTASTSNPDPLDFGSVDQRSAAGLAAQALEDEPPPANPAPVIPKKPKPPANKRRNSFISPPDTSDHRPVDQMSADQNSDSEDDFLEKTIRSIEALFETHPDDFTEKHQAWILDKVYKAADRAGIRKMLAYSEKVVKKATA
jgi:phage recombination protein Bet